jgi:hypothetical protein
MKFLCTTGLLLLAVAIAVCSTVIAAAPPVTVDTRVKIAMQGADFHIRTYVDPHPANRTICLHADLDGFKDVFKACWYANGTKTVWRWLKNMEAGKWEVYATVERNDNTTVSSPHMSLTVIGPDSLPDPIE